MTTLDDVIDFIDDPNAFHLMVVSGSSDARKIEFLDDSGLSSSNNEFFVAGDESGTWILIHARSFEDAWKAWIDERPTIPESELPEAYGVDDMPEMTAWKEVNPYPKHCGAGPEFQAWAERKNAEAMRILQARDTAARDGNGEGYPELIEGYEMQSNCSGTEIVAVGHYSWMREADLSEITLVRKTAEEIAQEKADKAKEKLSKTG